MEKGGRAGAALCLGFSLDLNVHLSFENLDLAVAGLLCFPFHDSWLSFISWPWRIYNPCTGSARNSIQSQKCIKPSLLGENPSLPVSACVYTTTAQRKLNK